MRKNGHPTGEKQRKELRESWNAATKIVRMNYLFLFLYDKLPNPTRDIITKPAPDKVTYVPENSLPKSRPSPIPPIAATAYPIFS